MPGAQTHLWCRSYGKSLLTVPYGPSTGRWAWIKWESRFPNPSEKDRMVGLLRSATRARLTNYRAPRLDPKTGPSHCECASEGPFGVFAFCYSRKTGAYG